MSEAQPDAEETERLLRQAQAGEPLAFERLFAGHRPYLRRLEAFCRDHGLEEADWYTRAVAALGRANER